MQVLSEMCIWLLRTPSLAVVFCGFPVKQPSLTWWLTRFKMERASWGLITIINTYPTVPFSPIFHFSMARRKEEIGRERVGEEPEMCKRRGVYGVLGMQNPPSPPLFSKVESQDAIFLSSTGSPVGATMAPWPRCFPAPFLLAHSHIFTAPAIIHRHNH